VRRNSPLVSRYPISKAEAGMPNRPQRPQVLIVGAGFGGLEATKALARADVDVTLVDAYNHHCFQPLLYQVATAALSPADVAWPIRAIMRKQKNVRVIMARVTGIDVAARRVHGRRWSKMRPSGRAFSPS
jgi:NADH dehydrogenase